MLRWWRHIPARYRRRPKSSGENARAAAGVVLDDLVAPDQERAQRVRVAAIHQD